MKAKKMIAQVLKAVLVLTVVLFLGMRSYEFFLFATPESESVYAILGFGLTGGGFIMYLVLLMWEADTTIKRVVCLLMLVVCGLGEAITAFYGMQINIWQKAGFVIDQEAFRSMLVVVSVLGLIHAGALLAYFAGDKIKEILGDEDGDGIPNFRDSDYRRPVFATEIPAPNNDFAMPDVAADETPM